MLKVGVIGYGYWGPNIARNFSLIDGIKLSAICDQKADVLKGVEVLYPGVKACTDAEEILKSNEIDVVAIITPVSTHYTLAKKALQNGKHIFVEKPFTTSLKEAEELISIASKKKLQIMVDHTFLFTGAISKIKELMDNKELGDLYYYDSTRISLGLFQQDVNVIWDLAPHDLSIMDYCLKKKPIAVTANGVDHFGKGVEDMAYITVYYEDNLLAHINVNWLSPVKVRSTFIAGEKRMLVWDDLQADEKIKIYDKGVSVENRQGMYKLRVDYRAGDMWAPRVDHTEALKKELEYFVQCIQSGEKPFNDGEAGLRIVKMLLATDESLKKEGKRIKL